MGMKRVVPGLAAAFGVAVSLTAGGLVHGQSEVERYLLSDGAGGGGVVVGGSLVAALRERGAEVEPLGRRGTLEGWLVVPAGERPYTLYVDETGHAVMGLLFSPQGKALSADQVGAVQQNAARRRDPEPVVRTRVPSSDGGRHGSAEARRGRTAEGGLLKDSSAFGFQAECREAESFDSWSPNGGTSRDQAEFGGIASGVRLCGADFPCEAGRRVGIRSRLDRLGPAI